MTNFRYDDDVLLKWEITGVGKWVGSYSHFNSMMNEQYRLFKEKTNGTRGFCGVNTLQVKISDNDAVVGRESCGCEVRNTHTWGAEAGEVSE
ncbi:MAG TPA: hypothetical protein VFC65_16355 [Prolixibacteraceae bacterium]|nr:hypothetical protein [Prolixibacteraceae bacterium]